MARSNWSVVWSASVTPEAEAWALFTSTSMRLNFSMAWSMTFCTTAWLSAPAFTSAATQSTWMPYSASSFSLAVSSFFTLRPVMTRFAPSLA